MKLTNEAILTQLGYNVTDNTLKDLEIIINNTKNFEKFKNHLIALNDHLKPLESYVAMSSTNPYFKIKLHDELHQDDAKEEIKKWAKKYNVELKQANEKTFYIIGVE